VLEARPPGAGDDRFGYPGLFGAYNAGPARYADWLAGKAMLPGETVAYLRTVGGAAGTAAPASRPPEPRFVVRRIAPEAPAVTAAPDQPMGLFVLRREDR